MIALPFFTLTSLIYGFLIWNKSEFTPVLGAETVCYLAITGIAASVVCGLGHKISKLLALDLFATFCLVFWFAHWSPIFGFEAPIFLTYPIYFSLLSVAITHFVMNQWNRFDHDQITLLRLFCGWKKFHPTVLMGATFGSLLVPKYYLLYAIVMTFLLIRYSFIVCLDRIDRERSQA